MTTPCGSLWICKPGCIRSLPNNLFQDVTWLVIIRFRNLKCHSATTADIHLSLGPTVNRNMTMLKESTAEGWVGTAHGCWGTPSGALRLIITSSCSTVVSCEPKQYRSSRSLSRITNLIPGVKLWHCCDCLTSALCGAVCRAWQRDRCLMHVTCCSCLLLELRAGKLRWGVIDEL